MLETDLRSGEIASTRVNFVFGDNPREYPHCYATYTTDGRVMIFSYYDPPGSIPRAVFNSDHIFVEHFGPHPHPSRRPGTRPATSQQPVQRSEGRVTALSTVAERREAQQRGMSLQTGVLPPPAKQEEKWQQFEENMTRSEEHPDEQRYLNPGDDSPKEETGSSSTEEESHSVPPLTETPSGRFMTSPVPTPEENQNRREMTSTQKRSRGGRQKHGSHGKPRPLPGAMTLLAMAMFLALSFRHTS